MADLDPIESSWRRFVAPIIVGIFAGVVFTMSPLILWLLAGAVALLLIASRGLPQRERAWVRALIVVALALRVGAVGALLVAAARTGDPGSAVLFGDEAYAQARALRGRAVRLDVPVLKFDYETVYDDYGRNRYITLLTNSYLVFGPSPYAMRVLNALVYVAGVVLLFHVARRAFGPLPAFGGLAVLLFLPTLFLWSVALLKEMMYFFFSAIAFAAAWMGLRSPSRARQLTAVVIVCGAVWMLSGLRAGGAAIAVGSIGLGVILLFAARSTRRAASLAVAAIAAAVVLSRYPPVQQRAADAVRTAAANHAAHVFTVGHAYKLLDEWFYMKPRLAGEVAPLTTSEAARFIVRGIVSFLTVPLPWQVATRSELVLMPDQLVWYGIVLLTPLGLVSGYRRDPVFTSLLLGFALTAAAAVAFTNGNVGTLVRFRGLVTPYLVWIGAVGLCVALRRLSSPSVELEPAR